jgi:hypothetical protein
MTKDEFAIYVQAILDMEAEKGELNGPLKLIREALDKIDQTQLQPSYPISPNLNPPFDWTYHPEHQPYYTVYCTTNTTQK